MMWEFLRSGSNDVPFTQDDNNRLLPWIIPMMVFLAALFLLGGMSLNAGMASTPGNFSERLSVQVPFERADAVTDAAKIVALMKKTKGVEDASILASDEIKRMLAPWLGTGAVVDSLTRGEPAC